MIKLEVTIVHAGANEFADVYQKVVAAINSLNLNCRVEASMGEDL